MPNFGCEYFEYFSYLSYLSLKHNYVVYTHLSFKGTKNMTSVEVIA